MNRNLNDDTMSLIRGIAIKLRLKADRDIKELGINSTQGRVLYFISSYEGDTLIQKDIAKFFNKKEATITSMLKGLEKKGLIERRIALNNERQKNIYLTEEGRNLINLCNNSFLKLDRDFKNILSKDEMATLNTLLLKLDRHIE